MKTQYKMIILIALACICSILIYYKVDKAKPAKFQEDLIAKRQISLSDFLGHFFFKQGWQSSSGAKIWHNSPNGPLLFSAVEVKIVTTYGLDTAQAIWALPESGDTTRSERLKTSANSSKLVWPAKTIAFSQSADLSIRSINVLSDSVPVTTKFTLFFSHFIDSTQFCSSQCLFSQVVAGHKTTVFLELSNDKRSSSTFNIISCEACFKTNFTSETSIPK